LRTFIYKVIIVCLAFGILFEFTVGRRINEINQKIQFFSTKEGRKDLINSLKEEMKKGIEKDKYFSNEEKELIKKFLNKIKKELE